MFVTTARHDPALGLDRDMTEVSFEPDRHEAVEREKTFPIGDRITKENVYAINGKILLYIFPVRFERARF
jgi:hypothetical protein